MSFPHLINRVQAEYEVICYEEKKLRKVVEEAGGIGTSF